MDVFRFSLIFILGYTAAQCPDESASKLSTCLGELKNISNRVAQEIPKIHVLAFPLFHFKKSHIIEICEEYDVTEKCIASNGTSFQTCPEHVVWRIVKSLFEYPCSSDAFLKEFECVAKQLAENKECEDKMKVPEVATVQWDKCSKAPVLYGCIGEKVTANCGAGAAAVLGEALKSAGCDNYKEPVEIRRRPVSVPKVAEKCPVECDILQTAYDASSVNTNATHPLFVLSEDDFDKACKNITNVDCSTCDGGVTKQMLALCQKPDELEKTHGCIGVLETRKPECLSYGCEDIEEFKSCSRSFVLDANCRRGLPAILAFLKVC